MRVAVIGGGISGLAAVHALRPHAHVSLFEAERQFGGHARTVDVTLDGVSHGVDIGFLVFNHRTYPGLVKLFETLGVRTAKSDMSFSVQVPGAFGKRSLEWSGHSLRTVFSDPRNAMSPRFLRMLRELLRFNTLGTACARQGVDPHLTLAQFLDKHRFGRDFREWYLLPMIGCIWSCPVDQMLQFPAATLLRFCDNHGLMQVNDRPQWYTVAGGSREYVRRIVQSVPDARAATPVRKLQRVAGGVNVTTDKGTEFFDSAVVATHPEQALRMLAEPTAAEREVLGAIRYQPNRAVLHTDASLLPKRPSAWAAWNYESGHSSGDARVCLHYLINHLQPLPWERPVVVSLNPIRPIDRSQVLLEHEFDHPVFDLQAIAAQSRVGELGSDGVIAYAGAWAGHGFHEDGLQAGHAAARRVLDAATRSEAVERLAA